MINLYLLGKKGLISIQLIEPDFFTLISRVIIGTDRGVINDYSSEIIQFCEYNRLNYIVQNKTAISDNVKYSIAIGWRWFISDNSKLFVFHDSILPRLRGFNPLVTALINGDDEIGVSVILATEEYDKGDIIDQQKVRINYPIKINQAIEKLSKLYALVLNNLLKRLESDNIKGVKQDECLASYSLWRDENDYRIDWSKSSKYIKRFIDAVGYPYSGACTFWNSNKYIIYDAFEENDVLIENREPGKVIFKKDQTLYIVCGEGILGINQLYNKDGQEVFLNNFRIRFI